jgi:hypothetical protein
MHRYPKQGKCGLRKKLDPDESGFSRTGVNEGRLDSIPDEIEAVFVAYSRAVLAYPDQRVLIRNDELGAAIRYSQTPVVQGYSGRAFEHP